MLEQMDISRSKGRGRAQEALTPKQSVFFQKLIEFWRRAGVPPTVRELQRICGYSSPRSVLQFLEVLESGGYIKRESGARNIRILRMPESTPHKDRARTVPVPIVGSVAAGLPILATQNIERVLQVEERLARPPGKYFLLQVQGDSMNRANIQDGDYVLVKQQPTAENGERVVALIDEEATVKILRKGHGAVTLEPRSTNASHKPILVTNNFQIQGVVVATIQDWEKG